MDLTLSLWLFGACGAGLCGAFSFAWAAHVSVSKCRNELYTYKVHAAEHFASIIYATAIEKRTVDALNEIKESLKGQGEKLDRLIERRFS